MRMARGIVMNESFGLVTPRMDLSWPLSLHYSKKVTRAREWQMDRASLSVTFGAIMVILLAGAGLVIWAQRPAINRVTPPKAASFNKRIVAKGALLVSAGYCAECHTATGGKQFAGGYPVPTPFGIIYGTNITPAPRTGIGGWSEAAFARAMHKGIRRDGAYLYPAFPYTHFTRVSDQDVKAIYAYLMTRPAVHNVVPPPRLPFPLNIRLVMAGWNLLYLHDRRFTPDPGKSAAWNRGASLAEGLGHCNACHGPRNWLGAEIKQARYAGGESEGWYAPALDQASPASAPWSRHQLVTYLDDGFADDHGMAAGPMEGVSRDLRKLPKPDVEALAAYILSFGRPASARRTAQAVAIAGKAAYHVTTAQAMRQQGPAMTGKAIFAGACASCHFEGGAQPFYRPVRLGLSSVVNAPDPQDFINIVMQGIQPPPGVHGGWMPPFGTALGDQQITLLARYVRRHFSQKPAWTNTGRTISRIRRGMGKESTEQ
jgi:mono/diheme cytochrome c family protein